MKTAPHGVVRGLNSLLDAISEDDVLEVQKDALFRHLCNQNVNADRAARIWIAERYLSKEIARRKLALLRSGVQESRPAPYHLPALADMP
ncbi:MAG TPA: hypothetical protein VGQ11_02165, partial [Candidatus Acidoferrales bacterium]|nr:hypothetical protein [Candidatus Acidoferrales bacterium]